MIYSKQVLEHFHHPRNQGTIKNPDGLGKVGNPVCGDVLWLYIKIGEKNGKKIIKNIKFQTFGCTSAIATSSMVTVLAKGKTLQQAMKITKDDILKKLGKLPPLKVHCSLLAVDGLMEALYDYFSRHKLPIPEKIRKEHARIKKELEKIEKLYGDYTKLEKKVLRRKT